MHAHLLIKVNNAGTQRNEFIEQKLIITNGSYKVNPRQAASKSAETLKSTLPPQRAVTARNYWSDLLYTVYIIFWQVAIRTGNEQQQNPQGRNRIMKLR